MLALKGVFFYMDVEFQYSLLRYWFGIQSDNILMSLISSYEVKLTYGHFKLNFGLEKYWLRPSSADRINITKLRCRNFKLPIETGRWNGIRRKTVSSVLLVHWKWVLLLNWVPVWYCWKYQKSICFRILQHVSVYWEK